ncbi:MAG: hypothetical protein KAU50_06745 [Candidatus Marinimicrobia bacterium]|nr:hypothetical protein [Candidatus Neomarinimicrobiota bacterium]
MTTALKITIAIVAVLALLYGLGTRVVRRWLDKWFDHWQNGPPWGWQ